VILQGKDQGSRLEHLEKVAQASGIRPPELDFEEPCETINYILDHFWRLKTASGVKISYTEIHHYSQLIRIDLCSFEVELIMYIDTLFENKVNG